MTAIAIVIATVVATDIVAADMDINCEAVMGPAAVEPLIAEVIVVVE